MGFLAVRKTIKPQREPQKDISGSLCNTGGYDKMEKANEKFKVPRVMLSMEKGHCSGTRFPLAQRVPFWVSCGYPTCHPAL